MIPEHRRAEITLAVQRVYKEAELDPETLNPGVVPLYDLIRAYPIRVAEVKDMTAHSVAEFLEAETGQVLPIPDNEDRKLAGYLYLQEYQGLFYGCILVEKKPQSAPVSRRRFSAAHELGHYLLHFLPLLECHQKDNSGDPLILTEGLYVAKKSEVDDESDDETDADSDEPTAQLTFTNGVQAVLDSLGMDRQQMEEEADQFAAELLMPAPACQELAKRYRRRFGNKRKVLARRLATEFLVSNEAMRRRLGDLKLPEKLADFDFKTI